MKPEPDRLLFDAPGTTAVAVAPEPGSEPQREPKAEIPAGPKPLRRGLSLKLRVEDELRNAGISFVAVDEAKKALFTSAKIESFHFVAYSHGGANSLIWCGEVGTRGREAMTQWASVFGEGFRAVFAVDRASGIQYRALSGERLSLEDLR